MAESNWVKSWLAHSAQHNPVKRWAHQVAEQAEKQAAKETALEHGGGYGSPVEPVKPDSESDTAELLKAHRMARGLEGPPLSEDAVKLIAANRLAHGEGCPKTLKPSSCWRPTGWPRAGGRS
jgi:hypothetical protein